MSEPQTDYASSLRTYEIVMLVTPIIAIILRFWGRALGANSKGPTYWWDDWVCLMALPLSVASNCLELYLIDLGFGRHIKTIHLPQLEQLLRVLFIDYWFGDACLTLTKASALLFYQRIFTTNSTPFRYALWIGYLLVGLWWISSIARCLLLCTPVVKYWKPKTPGFCRNTDKMYIASAVPSVIIDLYILVLPIPMLWGLQLGRARKFLISGVFVCGYLVVAISTGRLIFTVKAGNSLVEDLTYNGVPLLYLIAAEPALSIYCICLPAIFFLFRRIIQEGPLSIFSTSASSKTRLTQSSQRSGTGIERGYNNTDASETEVELTRTSGSREGDSGVPYSGGWHHHKSMINATGEYIQVGDEEDQGMGIRVRKLVDVRSDQKRR